MVDSLLFDKSNYEVKSLTLGKKTILYRAFMNLVYVRKPVLPEYQKLNIFVPEAYYHGEKQGIYGAEDSPYFMPNNIGGYMPGTATEPGVNPFTEKANILFDALLHGYIVISAGARGRGLYDDQGKNLAKAPAMIVDLKAAIRFVRHNKASLPGNTDLFFTDGTSAGGGMSALLGASGNSPDYLPFLEEAGAAEESDAVFASMCYCPVTNLEHIDKAFEWTFRDSPYYVQQEHKAGFPMIADTSKLEAFPLDEQQKKNSGELVERFRIYLNNLKLTKPDGSLLTVDADGTGTFQEYLMTFYQKAAQKQLALGTDLTKIPWIKMVDGEVMPIHLKDYTNCQHRVKPPVAYDRLDLQSGENEVFADKKGENVHFSEYGLKNSIAGTAMADPHLCKMMNPTNYIHDPQAVTAPYWRFRYGSVDVGSSAAAVLILATIIQNAGKDVDFAIAWGYGHAGDFDSEELFQWMDDVIHGRK